MLNFKEFGQKMSLMLSLKKLITKKNVNDENKILKEFSNEVKNLNFINNHTLENILKK